MEKTNEVKAYLKYQSKLVILKHINEFKSVTKALSEFKIPKSTYYTWKKAYDKDGEQGLIRKHPVAFNHLYKINEDIIDKVLSLRKDYLLGAWSANLFFKFQKMVLSFFKLQHSCQDFQ